MGRRDYGLATFMPTQWLERVRRKEVLRHLRFFLRKDDASFGGLRRTAPRPLNGALCPAAHRPPEEDVLNAAHILRIKYITLVSQLPGFGGRSFSVSYKPTDVCMIMQIEPKLGLVVRYPGRSTLPAMTIDLGLVDSLYLSAAHSDPAADLLVIKLTPQDNSTARNLEFLVDRADSDDFVALLQGYAMVWNGKRLDCFEGDGLKLGENGRPAECMLVYRPAGAVPPFRGVHFVSPAGWNYADGTAEQERRADFSQEPPAFEQALLLGQAGPARRVRHSFDLAPPGRAEAPPPPQ